MKNRGKETAARKFPLCFIRSFHFYIENLNKPGQFYLKVKWVPFAICEWIRYCFSAKANHQRAHALSCNQDVDSIVTESCKNPARFPAVSTCVSHCPLFTFHLILEESRRGRCGNPIFGKSLPEFSTIQYYSFLFFGFLWRPNFSESLFPKWNIYSE